MFDLRRGFFERLPPETQRRLIASGSDRAFQPGETIFEAGNDRWVGVVTQGLVHSYADLRDGRRRTNFFTGVGGVVGVGAVLGVGDMCAAQAVCATTALQLHLAAVRALRTEESAFTLAIAHEIHDRLVAAAAQMRLLYRGNLAQRIAQELVELTGDASPGEATIRVTHEGLAQVAGTSREVISRQLHAIAEIGLLHQDGRGRIRVPDIEALRAFACVNA